MIVTIQDFEDKPYDIANLDEHEEDFLAFAGKCEREILSNILGPLLFSNLEAGIVGAPNTWLTEWSSLVNGGNFIADGVVFKFPGLRAMLIPYIWFMWQRENHELVTENGAVQLAQENAVRISIKRKMVRAWNEFVDKCGYMWESGRGQAGYRHTLYGYLYYVPYHYGPYDATYINSLTYINEWDL